MNATEMNPEQVLRETIGAERFAAASRALREVAGLNGYGARLIDMVDTVLTEVADIEDTVYPEDRATEIADGAVPVYTHEIMEAIAESIELATWEPELGPAFGGEPTPANVAAGVLYEVASMVASNAVSQRF